MQVIERVKSWFVRGNKPQKAVSGWRSLFQPLANPPARGVSDWLNAYGEIAWVHAVIKRIAEAVADNNWHVEKKEGDTAKLIPEHPALILWNEPSALFTAQQLRELQQIYLEIIGEVFFIKERDNMNKVKELWPIPPHWVLQTPTSEKSTYKINLIGKMQEIPSTEIIWRKRPNPSNPYSRGLGDARSIGDDAEMEEYAVKFNKRVFYNDARPPFAITVEGGLNEQSAKRMQEAWMQKHGGFWNAFKPAILDHNAKIQTLGWNQRDMEFVELRKMARDTIIGNFGVPPSVLGIVEDVNRANAEAGEYSFAKWVIKPRLTFWRDLLSIALLREEFNEDATVVFAFENPVPEDKQFKLGLANDGLTRGAITRNEWRALMGFEAVKGGDVFLMPLSIMPETKSYFCHTQPPQGRAEGQPERLSAQFSFPTTKRIISDAEWENRWLKFVSQTAPREKQLIKILRKLFNDQEAVIQERLRNKVQQKQIIIKDTIDDIFGNTEEWGKLFVKEGKPLIQDAFAAAGKDAIQSIGANISFDLVNPRAQKFLENRLDTYLGKKVQVATLDALRSTLNEGFNAGESIDNLSTRIANVFDMARDFRSERIARTEIISSSNAGSLEGYKQGGVKLKSWLAALDERTRESHVAAHQRYQASPIPIDEEFELDGGSGPAPGSIGTPEEDINCRCTVLAEFEEE